MRLGLAVYSFKNAWCDAYGLMDRAASAGFRAVEFPAEGCLKEPTPEEMARARDYAAERGLSIVADGGRVNEEGLRRWIPQATALGAPVLRVIISGILGGNRRQMNGGWQAHLEAARDALKATRSLAEDHNVVVAVENHQDIASDELLWLCQDVGGQHIGVTLDTGSTLALGEDPLGYTERVKDYVHNVHLKDYKVYLSPTGYRLVRCALGEGVVPFPEFFAMFEDQPDLPMNVELGATQARHVELLEESWWTDYPPRRAQDLLGALRVVFAGARPPDEEWRTPHEREESGDACVTFEMDEFHQTADYLRRVANLGPARAASR